jgi:lipopolysaccharide/colanic/teichoic acid biosynthesis glycosyltransferase
MHCDGAICRRNDAGLQPPLAVLELAVCMSEFQSDRPLNDHDIVEPFQINQTTRRLTPRSALKLQILAGYPALYREVNRTEGEPFDPLTANGMDSLRALNVVVALIALILASPLFLIIAIAIKLTSKGPVFYCQTRIGIDRRSSSHGIGAEKRVCDMGGRPFTMYKFRTMVVDAERDGKAVWAAKNDSRVTIVGRYLRRSRLDELPQLINVLLGDMNVVGPRPERPSIFDELRGTIPSYHLRQRVLPGITGWAQVNQSYDTCVDDVRMKVDLDLEYVRQRSLAADISIMARTIPIMVKSDLGW